MDFAVVLNIALLVISAMGGWLFRILFDRMKGMEDADQKLADQVAALREALPTNYVRRDDFKQLGDNIFSALRRIEDKIDLKVDKP